MFTEARFPSCQFYLSKVDVMRPFHFHNVLKTSVVGEPWPGPDYDWQIPPEKNCVKMQHFGIPEVVDSMA